MVFCLPPHFHNINIRLAGSLQMPSAPYFYVHSPTPGHALFYFSNSFTFHHSMQRALADNLDNEFDAPFTPFFVVSGHWPATQNVYIRIICLS
jgi:hypothetical protein